MDANLLITDQELDTLKQTKSVDEWDRACDAIKCARNGQYPKDWWAKVMQTGLMVQVSDSWK